MHTQGSFNDTKNSSIGCIIPNFPLPEGEYYINVRARSQKMGVLDDVEYAAKLYVVGGDFYGTGKIPGITKGVLVNHYWD
jgi:hypothetical protein